jgi:hypothetical protein
MGLECLVPDLFPKSDMPWGKVLETWGKAQEQGMN